MGLRRAPSEYYLRRVEFAAREVLKLAGHPFFGWENRVTIASIGLIADQCDVDISYVEEAVGRLRDALAD